MTEQKWTTLATIQKTFERCQAENVGISRNLIRQLVLSGTIPAVKVGKNTHLINYDVLMRFLEEGTPRSQIETPEQGTIRRVEAR